MPSVVVTPCRWLGGVTATHPMDEVRLARPFDANRPTDEVGGLSMRAPTRQRWRVSVLCTQCGWRSTAPKPCIFRVGGFECLRELNTPVVATLRPPGVDPPFAGVRTSESSEGRRFGAVKLLGMQQFSGATGNARNCRSSSAGLFGNLISYLEPGGLIHPGISGGCGGHASYDRFDWPQLSRF